MKNKGKQFEKLVRQQFEAIQDVSVDRINDNVGYAGAYNIADLIVYRKPYKYYLELKTIKGTSFPFCNVNKKALTDLMMQSIIPGVAAYYIIWFVDLDLTIAINCRELYDKIYVEDKKSIGVKSLHEFEYIKINGKKKRTYYEYNLVELLNKFCEEMLWAN